MLGLELSCEEILENVNDYMGPVFEKICEQYLIRAARENVVLLTIEDLYERGRFGR